MRVLSNRHHNSKFDIIIWKLMFLGAFTKHHRNRRDATQDPFLRMLGLVVFLFPRLPALPRLKKTNLPLFCSL